MTKFEPVTEQIISLIKEVDELKKRIDERSNFGQFEVFSAESLSKQWELERDINNWFNKTTYILRQNGLELTALKIENESGINVFVELPLDKIKKGHSYLTAAVNELISACEEIEKKKDKKTIETITIDDIDNFKELLSKVDDDSIDNKYFESAFLENDVEDTFREIIKEPYKEQDSGAEMRDLYTTNIKIGGKRIHTAIMFKGRGVKKELQIADCGKNGNQLLKLSKNTTAQLYIVQHVNKIEPDVIEALKHHLLAYSNLNKIILCSIDGKDTARILKAAGKDLEELMKKKI